jgi:hypothetical protein
MIVSSRTPFIFGGKIGCEVELVPALDVKRGWRGVGGTTETKRALVGAEVVRQVMIYIDPDVALIFGARLGGVNGMVLPVFVVGGEVLVMEAGWEKVMWVIWFEDRVVVFFVRLESGEDAVGHELLVGEHGFGDRIVLELMVGDGHLVVEVSDLGQEAGVARWRVQEQRISIPAASACDKWGMEAWAVVADGAKNGDVGAIGVGAMCRRLWFQCGIVVDGSIMLGGRKLTDQGTIYR